MMVSGLAIFKTAFLTVSRISSGFQSGRPVKFAQRKPLFRSSLFILKRRVSAPDPIVTSSFQMWLQVPEEPEVRTRGHPDGFLVVQRRQLWVSPSCLFQSQSHSVRQRCQGKCSQARDRNPVFQAEMTLRQTGALPCPTTGCLTQLKNSKCLFLKISKKNLTK